MNFFIKLTSIACLLIFISSCSKKKDEVKNAASEYIKTYKILKDKRYIEAAEKFEAIYDDYPLSKWSLKAQTLAAYAFYKEERYEDVVRVVETFIQLNPSSEYVSYMQYMKSISYYLMIPSVTRGQNYTKMSSQNFRELVARFPGSRYDEDARDKISIIDEHLAGSLMSIGRYQARHQNYIGALMHYSSVVDRYSRTNHAPEAYYRLFEIYYFLGMEPKAEIVKKEMLNIFTKGDWVNKMNNFKAI